MSENPDASNEPILPPSPDVPPVIEVRDLDWQAVRTAVDVRPIRARMRAVVERMETLLDSVGGPGLLFDADRSDSADRAIRVGGPPLRIDRCDKGCRQSRQRIVQWCAHHRRP